MISVLVAQLNARRNAHLPVVEQIMMADPYVLKLWEWNKPGITFVRTGQVTSPLVPPVAHMRHGKDRSRDKER